MKISIVRHSASRAHLRSPLKGLGDDCSEVVQPMHGLDADVKVRRYIPHGANNRDQINSP